MSGQIDGPAVVRTTRGLGTLKILLSSHFFAPSIGGLETASALLADAFVAQGNEVRVVTMSAASASDREHSFRVIRRPSIVGLLQELRWCEIYVHNHISLRSAWPLAVVRRPWVIIHQTYIDGSGKGLVKRWISRRADIQVALSNRMAQEFDGAVVIHNPYDDKLFRMLPGVPRTRELIFVGRLVSEKGVSLLLRGVRMLVDRKVSLTLTVVGDGPERGKLEGIARELGVADKVVFAGIKRGTELVELLNKHKVMVVPSQGQETFGIVALEGLACGCTVVVADRGGLPEAVGSAGLVFEGDAPESLADCVERALTSLELIKGLRKDAPGHLGRHYPKVIAEQYLKLFRGLVK